MNDAMQERVDRMTDTEKRDLQSKVTNEIQKAKIHESTLSPLLFIGFSNVPQTGVHDLTNTCWPKCITGSITSGQLDKNEEGCIRNCVDRFMDASDNIVNHLSKLQGRS